MSLIEHDVEFVSGFIEGGYTVQCSCGWSSALLETKAEAHDAAEDHFDAEFERWTAP